MSSACYHCLTLTLEWGEPTLCPNHEPPAEVKAPDALAVRVDDSGLPLGIIGCCFTEDDVRDGMVGQTVRYVRSESQEGASDGRPSRDAPASVTAHRGSGAPSCDSAELAEIRAELKRDHYLSDGNAWTLLRMVDRLSERNRKLVELCEQSMTWVFEGTKLHAELRAAIEENDDGK